MPERCEHLVGAGREDRDPASARDVVERGRHEGLADVDGADDRDMGVRVEEAQRGELVEQRSVEGHLRRFFAPSLPTTDRRAGSPEEPRLKRRALWDLVAREQFLRVGRGGKGDLKPESDPCSRVSAQEACSSVHDESDCQGHDWTKGADAAVPLALK